MIDALGVAARKQARKLAADVIVCQESLLDAENVCRRLAVKSLKCLHLVVARQRKHAPSSKRCLHAIPVESCAGVTARKRCWPTHL